MDEARALRDASGDAPAAPAAVPAAAPAAHRALVQGLQAQERHLRGHERAWRRRVKGHVKLNHTSMARAAALASDVHVLTTADIQGWRRSSPHSVSISGLGQLAIRHAHAARRQGSVLRPGDDHYCTLPCEVCGDCPESGTRGGVTHIACPACGADVPRDLASTNNEARRNCVFAAEAYDALLLLAASLQMGGAAGAAP